MATAMTFRTKTSSSSSSNLVNGSPIVNSMESSYSPSSSSTMTLSPQSSNSISSPDRSYLSSDQQQSLRLVDYFVVCGLDKYSDVQPSTEFILTEQISNPFQSTYQCRVLAHYPNELSTNPFDENAISRLSMPNGVSIKVHSSDPPTTHPFLITRLDGTRYYGVALTFYEQLNNHDENNHSSECLSSSSSSSQAVLSFNQLLDNYQQTSRNARRSSFSSSIYASKAICLIGPQAHYSTFRRILELLYQMTIEHDLLGLTFEGHLYNILHELYIPSPLLSHSVLKFNVGERQLTVWQPSLNDDDLPLLDFNLLEFFSLLTVDGVVDLVTCALLEHQIILKSSGKSSCFQLR